ncbi:Protein mak11 [Emydomyces testavorans]|uniref:Protein mak11 n=1 Tax=Emydomyces testavorans TaxID=2070801 RepID=A0AAF0DLZ8_9EURO|nr:Protein mak11 [Emydomyces testavorans]
MAKRKREDATARADPPSRKALKPTAEASNPKSKDEVTLQIVTGSYERVLHGITATIPPTLLCPSSDKTDEVQFADTFLFHAHASAIRCLALSPISQDSQTVTLASGGTDERINLYTLSASRTPNDDRFPAVPTLAGKKILENPKNRELGSLLHHSSSITALYFPTRSKLLAAAEDNTISVTRMRDMSVVSTIKAPRPKVHGRPSGDTAPAGAAPTGVNDFAVHPSMKLMLSVGRGERCMRLWNLVTGRKAGVLNFGREVLDCVKEGKWGRGEGRKITWDSAGQEFAVAFERGAVVFGIIKYIHISEGAAGSPHEFLAVSTEDGRILFYSTSTNVLSPAEMSGGSSAVPAAPLWYQLGGKAQGQSSRIKGFEFLTVNSGLGHTETLIVVTAGSDGVVKLWVLDPNELSGKNQGGSKEGKKEEQLATGDQHKNVGRLLGAYDTGNRITCLVAFAMTMATEEDEIDEFSGLSGDEESESASNEEESE